MAANRGARASLRIISDDLDPDQVTEMVGFTPTSAHRMGDERVGSNGRKAGIWRTGAWGLKAPKTQEAELEDQIVWLLAACTDDLAIWAALNARYRVDVFAGIFLRDNNEALELTPETLRALGERGIKLGLDMYGP